MDSSIKSWEVPHPTCPLELNTDAAYRQQRVLFAWVGAALDGDRDSGGVAEAGVDIHGAMIVRRCQPDVDGRSGSGCHAVSALKPDADNLAEQRHAVCVAGSRHLRAHDELLAGADRQLHEMLGVELAFYGAWRRSKWRAVFHDVPVH